MISRRRFITGFVTGLTSLAATASAQEYKAQQVEGSYRVGLVSVAVDPAAPTVLWQAFSEAMRERNYVEGRNLVLRRAFAAGKPERLPGLVTDLVRERVDVIVTSASGETRAAKSATSTIPIVMTVVPDPVGEGLVASLARPGGNVTGLTSLTPGVSQKYVELLREVIPSTPRFAVIGGPRAPIPEIQRELASAAERLGCTLSFHHVQHSDDLTPVLARAKKRGATGIIVAPDALTYLYRTKLVEEASKNHLPGIYWSREFADVGGLMTYGANLRELGRHAAIFVDKILRGAKPADLPVEQPTAFDLVINLKTAKALGLAIPPSLLARADQVID